MTWNKYQRKQATPWYYWAVPAVVLGFGALVYFALSIQPKPLPQQPAVASAAQPQETAALAEEAPKPKGWQKMEAIPAEYQVEGRVGDQYTVAVDPKTGDMLIHDSLGGVGMNTTSVEGQRIVKSLGEMSKAVDEAESRQAKQWFNGFSQKAVGYATGTASPSDLKSLKNYLAGTPPRDVQNSQAAQAFENLRQDSTLFPSGFDQRPPAWQVAATLEQGGGYLVQSGDPQVGDGPATSNPYGSSSGGTSGPYAANAGGSSGYPGTTGSVYAPPTYTNPALTNPGTVGVTATGSGYSTPSLPAGVNPANLTNTTVGTVNSTVNTVAGTVNTAASTLVPTALPGTNVNTSTWVNPTYPHAGH